jgi:hypothetical protein
MIVLWISSPVFFDILSLWHARSRVVFFLPARTVWQRVAMNFLQFQPGLPCPTLLRPADGPLLKQLFLGVACGRYLPLLTPLAVRLCRPPSPLCSKMFIFCNFKVSLLPQHLYPVSGQPPPGLSTKSGRPPTGHKLWIYFEWLFIVNLFWLKRMSSDRLVPSRPPGTPTIYFMPINFDIVKSPLRCGLFFTLIHLTKITRY